MSTTTPSPGMQIIGYEQCDCTHCNSVIPQQNIVKNFLPQDNYAHVRQCVKALCEHCGTMYTLTRSLIAGHWEIEAPGVQQVTSIAEIGKFRRRLEAQRGDIHVETPSAA